MINNQNKFFVRSRHQPGHTPSARLPLLLQQTMERHKIRFQLSRLWLQAQQQIGEYRISERVRARGPKEIDLKNQIFNFRCHIKQLHHFTFFFTILITIFSKPWVLRPIRKTFSQCLTITYQTEVTFVGIRLQYATRKSMTHSMAPVSVSLTWSLICRTWLGGGGTSLLWGWIPFLDRAFSVMAKVKIVLATRWAFSVEHAALQLNP